MEEWMEFFKSVFQLEDKEVEWGIIEVTKRENGDEDIQLRPGLLIKGSSVCLDLFARRFYSLVDRAEITRKIHPATMQTEETGLVMIDEDDPENEYVEGKMVISAKDNDRMFLVYDDSVFESVFCNALYVPQLEEGMLL
jgi:hypothetical protein